MVVEAGVEVVVLELVDEVVGLTEVVVELVEVVGLTDGRPDRGGGGAG